MKKIILVFIFVFFSIFTKAHQSNISTTMLVEKENNVWILQVRASLTAFQQEIKTHFAETPYKTPEEFKEMVLIHLRNNLKIILNDKNMILKKGYVKLGHETNVVFELVDIPNKIENLKITNTAFQDIYKSESALVILKEGFTKERFMLNVKNKHSMLLNVDKNKFVNANTTETQFATSTFFIILICSLLFLMLLFSKLQKLQN